MAERPELRLVREHLETVLSPPVAASVLFTALEAGKMPESALDVARLVDGPLRTVLVARMRQAEVDSVVGDVLSALAPALSTSGSVASSPMGYRGDVTLEVPISSTGEAVRLVVMAGSETFAQQIEAALGPLRVTAVTLRSVLGLRRVLTVAVTAPDIVVIDASRFPAIEPTDLADALAAMPATTARIVWGADLPYGESLMREVLARKAQATSIDRSEGVEPILDLIGSRSGRPTLPP